MDGKEIERRLRKVADNPGEELRRKPIFAAGWCPDCEENRSFVEVDCDFRYQRRTVECVECGCLREV